MLQRCDACHTKWRILRVRNSDRLPKKNWVLQEYEPSHICVRITGGLGKGGRWKFCFAFPTNLIGSISTSCPFIDFVHIVYDTHEDHKLRARAWSPIWPKEKFPQWDWDVAILNRFSTLWVGVKLKRQIISFERDVWRIWVSPYLSNVVHRQLFEHYEDVTRRKQRFFIF